MKIEFQDIYCKLQIRNHCYDTLLHQENVVNLKLFIFIKLLLKTLLFRTPFMKKIMSQCTLISYVQQENKHLNSIASFIIFLKCKTSLKLLKGKSLPNSDKKICKFDGFKILAWQILKNAKISNFWIDLLFSIDNTWKKVVPTYF